MTAFPVRNLYQRIDGQCSEDTTDHEKRYCQYLIVGRLPSDHFDYRIREERRSEEEETYNEQGIFYEKRFDASIVKSKDERNEKELTFLKSLLAIMERDEI